MVNVSLRHRPPRRPAGRPARAPANANVPQQVRARHPRWPYYLGAALVVLVFAGIAALRYADRLRDEIAFEGKSSDPAPVALTVAGRALAVPGNMIRFPAQRHPGAAERLDLFMDWPALEGLTEANAAIFRDVAPAAPLIFVTVLPGPGETPIARLEMLYSRLFTGASWSGPDGLVGRSLDPDSAYAGEELYYEAATVTPFIARCLASGTETISATCLAEFDLGGLTVNYRFDKTLLEEWRTLDARLKARLAGFLAS